MHLTCASARSLLPVPLHVSFAPLYCGWSWKESETRCERAKKRMKRFENGLKKDRNTTNVMCCFSSSFCVFFLSSFRWLLVHHFQCKWQKLLLQTHLPKIIYQAYLHSENSITVRYTLVHASLCALFQCHSLASDVCIPYNCGTEVLA